MNESMEREREMEMNGMEYVAPHAEEAGEVTAAQLGAEMTQDAQAQGMREQAQETNEQMDLVREGVGELFEDGWSAQELTAFSQDPTVHEAIAKGHSVARAACAYLRARLSRRYGVPTARTIATAEPAQENPIESMTDEQFDAFSRRAQAAMMSGKQVRL